MKKTQLFESRPSPTSGASHRGILPSEPMSHFSLCSGAADRADVEEKAGQKREEENQYVNSTE